MRLSSVKLIADVIANACIEGKQGEAMELAQSDEQEESEEKLESIEEVVANEEDTVVEE